MARALIVGCGCRGRELGAALAEVGWQVRGTTRGKSGAERIVDAGIEPAVADPLAVGTVFELIEGVALVYWLMGSVRGPAADVAAVNGDRLESLLAKLVDTPVRGVVFEGGGTVAREHLAEGARVAREASERWRIPIEIVDARPADHATWREEMLAAGERALLSR